VRNYARLLRIDPEPLVRSIGERFEAPDAGILAARYSQPVPFSDSARRSTFVYLALSLGVLAIGAGVGWQWYHERGRAALLARAQSPTATVAKAAPARTVERDRRSERPRAAPAPRPKIAEHVAEAPPPQAKAAPAKALPANPEGNPGAVEKVADAKPLPVMKVAPGVHRLVIRCEEQAWIEVRDATERALVSSLNPPGAERIVQARGPLTLVIGNAQHVNILHNDQPIDLAPYIKVETARFTLP
jgi:cytoskeleton protein RodZ